MPFKPRIIRFDDEHASVPEPLGGNSSGRHWRPLRTTPRLSNRRCTIPRTTRCAALNSKRFAIGTVMIGTLTTRCSAIRSCNASRRQLSDDAAALAKRYPADGWEPPAMETAPTTAAIGASLAESELSRVRQFFAKQVAWRRWLGLCAAAAACLAIAIGPQSMPNANPTKFDPGTRAVPSAATPLFAASPARQVHYQDGDEALWGPELIDDSQFGESPFGVDSIEDGPHKVLSAPGHDALRELLPADSHDYCEVSM